MEGAQTGTGAARRGGQSSPSPAPTPSTTARPSVTQPRRPGNLRRPQPAETRQDILSTFARILNINYSCALCDKLADNKIFFSRFDSTEITSKRILILSHMEILL